MSHSEVQHLLEGGAFSDQSAIVRRLFEGGGYLRSCPYYREYWSELYEYYV